VLKLSTTRDIAAVNMSLGGGMYTTTAQCDSAKGSIKLVVDDLRAVGIATVVAAGNNGSSTGMSAPGCISTVISVGSTRDNDQISGFSNETPAMTVHAPGESVRSAMPGGGLGWMSGTSMAAPHVAGAVALLREKADFVGAAVTVDNLIAALQQTGVPLTGRRFQVPRIQVDAALELLDSTVPDSILLDTQIASLGGATTLPSAASCAAATARISRISGQFSSVTSIDAFGGTALRDTASGTGKAVCFRPQLPRAGSYDVYGFWPEASAALLNVEHAGGWSTEPIIADGGGWQHLGTFSFEPAAGHYVEIASDAGAPLTVDALRFDSVGGLFLEASTLPGGWAGSPYSAALSAVGGMPPYEWSVVAGALPQGLALDPLSGLIGGTPTESGSFSFTVQVSDAFGADAQAQFTLGLAAAPIGGEGFSAMINFQPFGVPIPAGYEADTGEVFGDRGNGLSYGWDADISGHARDRNNPISPDQRYDTLNHTVFYGRVGWEIAVPNGDYEVMLAVGEPDWAGKSVSFRIRMLAEGVEVVDAQITGTSWYAEGTATVSVTDGRLRLEPAAEAERGKVLYVTISRVVETAGNQAPTVELVAPTASTSYTLGQSIALAAAATDADGQIVRVEFYEGSTKLGEDLSAPYSTDATYSMEWTPSEAGEYSLTVVATDDGGRSATSNAVSVTVVEADLESIAQINFQPAGVPIPAGYEADTGAVFGDRGNGLSYGWDTDVSGYARDRNNPISPDQRYDTLNHTVFYGRVGWEIAVPNGDYEVMLAVGEPDWAGKSVSFRIRMLAEGVEVVDAQITGTSWYAEGTATVSVTDGRLRLEPAAEAERGKVLYVTVSRVAD
jgi:hypothetical protein